METIIQTYSLSKQYHGKKVVQELDLAVPCGSIYGFLGPNGAGKSTTMKMLLGLTKPSGGSVRILGRNLSQENRLDILKNTGSLIESPAYYGHLSGRENLSLIASLKQLPMKEVDDILDIVHLQDAGHKRVSHYSLGMKQRLGFAAALLGHPKLLLLDEPTNGLDPAGIQEMRSLICALPQRYGMTVLVSSHLLSEIDQMATHVGILHHGSLIFQDKLSVLHEHSHSRMYLRTTADDQAFHVLRKAALPVIYEHGKLYLDTGRKADILRAGKLLYAADLGILHLAAQQKSLEDIFLQLTGMNP